MRSRDADIRGMGRIVCGQISSSGGIVSGTGFTVTHSGTGIYLVALVQGSAVVSGVEFHDYSN